MVCRFRTWYESRLKESLLASVWFETTLLPTISHNHVFWPRADSFSRRIQVKKILSLVLDLWRIPFVLFRTLSVPHDLPVYSPLSTILLIFVGVWQLCLRRVLVIRFLCNAFS